MTKKQRKGISVLSSQITATVSVALVLLLLGLMAMLGIGAASVTRSIQEDMGFNVVLSDSVTPEQVNMLKKQVSRADYTSSVRYISSDDAMIKWNEETGEDLKSILDINPFRGELEVKVKAKWANSDSLEDITKPLERISWVDEVKVPEEIVDTINANMRTIALVLLIISVALLFISFALISNTVHLAIYSRRFTIHTMKLVGATGGFIRRPFITTNMVCGIIAALTTIAILAGGLAYLHSIEPDIARVVPWSIACWVFGALLVLGIVICVMAATVATNRYLRKSYDDMFR